MFQSSVRINVGPNDSYAGSHTIAYELHRQVSILRED